MTSSQHPLFKWKMLVRLACTSTMLYILFTAPDFNISVLIGVGLSLLVMYISDNIFNWSIASSLAAARKRKAQARAAARRAVIDTEWDNEKHVIRELK